MGNNPSQAANHQVGHRQPRDRFTGRMAQTQLKNRQCYINEVSWADYRMESLCLFADVTDQLQNQIERLIDLGTRHGQIVRIDG